MMYDIQLQRIYAPVRDSDGARVLVDRVWPRGKRRDALMLTDWYKDASPSTELRRAWHSDKLDYAEFASRYQAELTAHLDCLVPLMRYARLGRLTLLTASRDLERSHLPGLQKALIDALLLEDKQADGCEPSSPTCYFDAVDPDSLYQDSDE